MDAILITLGFCVVFVVFYLVYKHFMTNAKVSPTDEFTALDPTKKKEEFRNYEDSARQERVENFYREQHTNQDYEYVMKKREEHLKFDKCVKTVWEMAEYLDTVTDDSDPDTDLTQLMHAIQTAEACRKAYPDDDWMHVAAFIHDLGKILLVNDESLKISGDPQWAVVGDTYPVGCKFDDSLFFQSTSSSTKTTITQNITRKWEFTSPTADWTTSP